MKEERNNTSTCSPCPLVLRMQNNFIFHKKVHFLLQLSFFPPSSGLFSSLTYFDDGPFPVIHYLFNKEYFISGNNNDVSLSECFYQALLQAFAFIISKLHNNPAVVRRGDILIARSCHWEPRKLCFPRSQICCWAEPRPPWFQKLCCFNYGFTLQCQISASRVLING